MSDLSSGRQQVLFYAIVQRLLEPIMIAHTIVSMRWPRVVTIALVSFLALSVFAGDRNADRRKAETVARADKLFGERYSPPAGKPLRLFDQQTESGPPDAVIYWHGASYVIELVFAPDGSVARVGLLPEELLHSDSWTDVPDRVQLSRAEMQSLIESANALQPLGKGKSRNPPDVCFQSGQNLYCTDGYEFAVVSHYHRERPAGEHVADSVLRDVTISYRQSVSGVVEDVRVEGSQRQLKVGGYWYHGEKPGSDIFRDAAIGSLVELVAFGCAGNGKVCLAIPKESKSGVTK